MPRRPDDIGALKWKERFQANFEKTEGCWIWNGAPTKAGYGLISVMGKRVLAHRLSYELAKGPIPNGLELDHLCRNRRCVNPDHLEAVPHKTNIIRGDLWERRKTHCPNGHPLVEANLVPSDLKLGRRRCLICNKKYHHDYGVAHNWQPIHGDEHDGDMAVLEHQR